MSKTTERIKELAEAADTLEAVRVRLGALTKTVLAEVRDLRRKENARKCRKRVWLYYTANVGGAHYKGPRLGDRVRVRKHGRKYAEVIFRGYWWRGPYTRLGTEKPGNIGANRALADVLDAAGVGG